MHNCLKFEQETGFLDKFKNITQAPSALAGPLVVFFSFKVSGICSVKVGKEIRHKIRRCELGQCRMFL